MRKEIIGILLFFLVIFMLGSLLSYSPADPSIHNAKALGSTHNLFGVFGSHSASIFIGLFGLGAFWLPILLLFASIHFFCKHPRKAVVLTIVGGILLVITTGSLLAFQQNHHLIFGSKFLIKNATATFFSVVVVLTVLTVFGRFKPFVNAGLRG